MYYRWAGAANSAPQTPSIYCNDLSKVHTVRLVKLKIDTAGTYPIIKDNVTEADLKLLIH